MAIYAVIHYVDPWFNITYHQFSTMIRDEIVFGNPFRRQRDFQNVVPTIAICRLFDRIMIIRGSGLIIGSMIVRTIERKQVLYSRVPVSKTYEVSGVGTVLLKVSKRAKYLRITIKPDRSVSLTVPRGMSYKKAKQFLNSRIPWIKKHLLKFEQLQNNHDHVRQLQISKIKARAILVSRLKELADQHDFRFNKVSIRNQKTKWGSCSVKNNISLNMNLATLPDELRDYVLLHELVHTRIKNHSPEFWAVLNEYVDGRAKEYRRLLKTYRL